MADDNPFASLDPAGMRQECERWIAGERFPVDWERTELLGADVASRFDDWLEVARNLALGCDTAEPINDVAYVVAAGLEADRALLGRFGPEFRLAPQLAALVAESIDHAFMDEASILTLDVLSEDVVVDTYVRYTQREVSSEYDVDFWAWEVVTDLVGADRERAWQLLLRAIGAAPDDILDQIGAGPLENFVGAYAGEFIDEIEQAAADNPKLRTALSGLWIWDDVDEAIFDRLARAARSDLDRPHSQGEADERRAWNAVAEAASNRIMEISEFDVEPGSPEDAALAAELEALLDWGDHDADE